MKTYHKKNLKDQILQYTYEQIKQNGYESITIREIAKQLNVSSAAIYRHFVNVEELMHEVMDLISEDFKDTITKDIAKSKVRTDRLLAYARNYLGYIREQSTSYEFLMLSPYTIMKSNLYVEENLKQPGIAFLYDFLEQWNEEEGKNFDTREVFLQLWSFMLGYGLLVHKLQYPVDETLVTRTISALMKGDT